MNVLMKNICGLLLFVFGFSTVLLAQQQAWMQIDGINQVNNSANVNSNMADKIQTEIFPVGNAIDENNYFIGPNDILSIQVIPSDPLPQLTVVTSECSIVNAFFGSISLKELSLKQVRDTLNAIANKRKAGLKVIVSLAQPRKVLINVRGNVISQGTLTLPASYSIATVIRFVNQTQPSSAGNNAEEQATAIQIQEARKDKERIFSESGMPESSSYGTRNIRLIRSNGTAMIVDLERYLATNDNKYNPFIKEGDEIFVPFEETEYSVISIAGEVLRPTSVVYKNGDLLSHLIKMGHGFTENADLTNIILHDISGATQHIEIDSAGNLLSEDFYITPGTAVIVGSKYKKQTTNFGIVSVRGEVNTPNIYKIELNETRLTDIIDMAGGFTDKAYLPLATIARRDNTQNERVTMRRRYNEFFRHSNMTQQDTARMSMELSLKTPSVSCDFVACFVDNKEENNILLQDGDVIFVPQKPNKVYVFGQINNPGFIDFEEHQTMDWYINKAGGYATYADPKRASMVRGSNRVWIDGNEENVFVNDGDEIYVPSPRDVPPEMEWQKWAAWAGIAGVVMSFISVVVFGIIDRTRN